MVQKQLTDWVEVPVTTMVPEQPSVVAPRVRCRPVTEDVTRQAPVGVPDQVPVTVTTTQVRPVARQVLVTRTVMVATTVLAASGQTPTPRSQP
jgi:hypothetical protein